MGKSLCRSCFIRGLIMLAGGIVWACCPAAGEPADDFDPKANEQKIQQVIQRVKQVVAQGPYKADWESLARHQPAPEWFQDAKFGIYFHWGVYSVPAYGNEWYPRWMHEKSGRRSYYEHHLKTWGDPSEFGYHDFVPMFKAEHFDADQWAELFARAGARYAGPVCEHHDGYAMWASELTPWNAGETGPKRDITGELAEAIRKRGMRLVTTFHHAHNPGHYPRVEGWPTTSHDPKLQMLYGNMPREKFLDLWLAKLAEVIDKYQPDLMWFDSWLHEIPEEYRQLYCAYYLNRAEQWGKQVVITRKQDDLPLSFTVEDFEKGRANRLTENVWLTDDTISTGSWCYTQDLQIKPTSRVLHDFIDIVSKNGCLLLNISPKADGTIPDNQRRVLLEIGDWLRVNGEAIYCTRPWLTFGEGPTRLGKGGGFVRAVAYTWRDVRYTRSKDGKVVYAIVLGWPEADRLVLRAVKVERAEGGRVSLVGSDAEINHKVDEASRLVIEVPHLSEAERPCKYAYVFKLTGFKLGLNEQVDVSTDLVLEAGEARLAGSLQLEEKIAGRTNIGFWDDPQDRVVWHVQIKRPGRYRVRAVVAATAPSKLALEAAGKRLAAAVPGTGAWDQQQTIELGTLSIEQAGVVEVLLRPADKQNWRAVNVWQVELVPAE